VVKPILQLYPVVAANGEAEREALRPPGRDVERFNDALLGMNELVRAADELGFWGVSSEVPAEQPPVADPRLRDEPSGRVRAHCCA
jgi:hypothetical protein